MAKPTMSDVARAAGVDVSTVSRALNERTSRMLRAETVERVLAAAHELGYRPNVLARGLRTQRSHTIGMVIPDLTNPFFPPIVRGLEDVLEEAEYTLILANTDNDPAREERSIRTLVGRQVDGLLVATSHLDDGVPTEELGGLPIVLVNRRGADERMPAVVPDDAHGVRLVVEHLTGLGHRHIGHIAGPQDTSTGHTRAVVFRDASEAAGTRDDELVEHAEVFAVEAGRTACHRLLERRSDVTALFAANDLLAIGCLRALRDRGISVPEGMSLVGFNDMPLVDLIEPPLTTLRVPKHEMGRRAGQMLLDLIQQPTRRPSKGRQVVELAPELIVRRSTQEPRVAG